MTPSALAIGREQRAKAAALYATQREARAEELARSDSYLLYAAVPASEEEGSRRRAQKAARVPHPR